ncbi:hypothetical protein DSL92_07825 [Billgrantia gudaonensis]|uniref:Haem-binding uptake Tiki superfamily ChaN domain-containing protein n=1 Tax=Billgrantia gudaonensis TaxID=376427 RepID=A0A3S0QRE4_9GAMM|nr:hypothetical protein DSL92_07825 [Halomonas gudaonensis]
MGGWRARRGRVPGPQRVVQRVGYDPDLYWPILHFALVCTAFPSRRSIRPSCAGAWWMRPGVRSPDERYRITVPARPDEKYRETLARFYAQHPTGDDDDGLAFVTAQLAWDRAMATGLAEAGENGALGGWAGGRGHLRFRMACRTSCATWGSRPSRFCCRGRSAKVAARHRPRAWPRQCSPLPKR